MAAVLTNAAHGVPALNDIIAPPYDAAGANSQPSTAFEQLARLNALVLDLLVGQPLFDRGSRGFYAVLTGSIGFQGL
jgi:hypothetical protein